MKNPFTDELGYLRCPYCEHQIASSLWCDRCEDSAENLQASMDAAAERWRNYELNREFNPDGPYDLPVRRNDDGSWSVAA